MVLELDEAEAAAEPVEASPRRPSRPKREIRLGFFSETPRFEEEKEPAAGRAAVVPGAGEAANKPAGGYDRAMRGRGEDNRLRQIHQSEGHNATSTYRRQTSIAQDSVAGHFGIARALEVVPNGSLGYVWEHALHRFDLGFVQRQKDVRVLGFGLGGRA